MLLQTDVAENAHTISAWLKEIETRGFLNYPQLSDQVHNNKECAKSNCEGTSLMQIIIFTMHVHQKNAFEKSLWIVDVFRWGGFLG